ncbi:MAG: hypothetical protein EOP84_14635 [Verrucomicrobiaceae bacterium]|nr:MAG: hypothetical protein EOP84_14635 [Verrucomicrobiaceae bacterium]
MVDINGTQKQLESMVLLNSVSGSRDVSRSFNDQEAVILRARFTDGTQAVLTLRMVVKGSGGPGPV